MQRIDQRLLAEVAGFPSHFVWPTELNELRPLAYEADAIQDEQILFELKVLTLFNRHVAIQDAFMLNCGALQRLIVRNTDNIRIALQENVICLTLRQERLGFEHLNQTQERQRFRPTQFELAKAPTALLDETLCRSGIAAFNPPEVRFVFEDTIERLLASDRLDDTEGDLLRAAYSHALEVKEKNQASFVSAGVLYNTLLEWRQGDPSQRVVQACRAACLLQMPKALDVAASSAISDIDPTWINSVVGNRVTARIEDKEKVFVHYPRNILSASTITGMTFDSIVRLRESVAAGDFFDALSRVRDLARGAGARSERVKPGLLPVGPYAVVAKYLEALQVYMECIAEGGLLVQWKADQIPQFHDAEDEARYQEIRKQVLCHSVPVATVMTATVSKEHWHSWPDFVGIQPLAALLGLGESALIEKARKVLQTTFPSPLARLLRNSSVQPVLNVG